MNTQNTRFATFSAIIETILLFIAGIIGNKIAEKLRISSASVFIITGICLISLVLISYFKTHTWSTSHSANLAERSFRLNRFLPRTMLGIFPFGLATGFFMGSVLPIFTSGDVTISSTQRFRVFQWLYEITEKYSFYTYEAWGILIGVILCLIFAILVDGFLAGAFAFGLGLSFATAILVVRSSENVLTITYFGYGVGYGIFALALVIVDPILKKIRKTIIEPRF